MATTPPWQFDEFVQRGWDFSDAGEVRRYEQRMAQLSDPSTRIEEVLEALALQPTDVLLDMGCGTAEVSVAAAASCRAVHAADVSDPMLAAARERAAEAGVSNITFHRAGFLTYEHSGEPVDVIFTRQALHHLPDFWKQIALARLAGALRDGGRMYVEDAVVSYELSNYREFTENSIARTRQRGMDDIADQIERHVREEFNTFDWIMEGMLSRAGFRIDRSEYRHGVLAIYQCTRAR